MVILSQDGFKGELPPFKKVSFICFSDRLLMKNAFYFTLETLFVLRIFNFCTDFFCHVAKRLAKKATVNLKIYGVINWMTNHYFKVLNKRPPPHLLFLKKKSDPPPKSRSEKN